MHRPIRAVDVSIYNEDTLAQSSSYILIQFPILIHKHTGHAMRKCVFRHMRTAQTKISLRIAQSNQGIPCPFTESVDTIECINDEQKPGRYLVHVQDDLNMRIFSLLESTFLLGSAH